MNKLLIESGATKSEWCFIQNMDGLISVESSTNLGWNASSSKESLDMNETQKRWLDNADEVYFYGAGVSSDYSRNRVVKELNYPDKLVVDSDLKAACLASLGAESGIVSILGTGSISCLWDGENANVVVPSLGYLLSDEGSGSDMGKEILRSYFYKQMPQTLMVKFDEEYKLTPAQLIDNLYSKPGAKSYLASFTKFLTNNEHEWCQNLITERLKLFFDIRIMPIYHKKISKMGFIGSISFVFKDYLMEICSQLEIDDIVVCQTAIDGLIKYHKTYNE
jgi:glucosamine kinase